MDNHKLKQFALSTRNAIGRYVDPKVVGGALVGGALVMATSAVAFTDGANIFVPRSSEMVTQTEMVVANQLKEAEARCGEEGGVGHAINTAMQIHTEMASISPDVEQLFNVADDCWSGVSQIMDLSFAIPSLAAIVGAASSAVMKYAEKKVCSAFDKATGMVTGPINQGLGKVSTQFGGLNDINGLVNGGIGGAFGQIDPDLGKEYKSPPASTTYRVDQEQLIIDGAKLATGQPIGQARTVTPPPVQQAPAAPTQSQGSLLDRMGNLLE